MRQRIIGTIVGVTAAALFAVAAINASAGGSGESPRAKLTLIAPAAPGGGWDGFAREAQHIMRTNAIGSAIQVVNIPGASGTIGLGALAEMDDRHDVMMVTGGVMVGGILINNSSVDLEDVTPIARLADDFNVLVVPGDSPYDTLDDFMADLATNPGGTAVAGGSLGGIDHLLAGMLGQAAGVDPSSINYLAYPGGGEVVTSILSHTAKAGLSGYNEFRDQIEAGNLRALAVSAAEPVDGIDVPTFVEQGYDVAMSNWRGYVAPPGISDEVRDELVAMVTEMRETPEWEDALRRYDWVDSYMVGAEFEEFIRTETERTEAIVKELGL
ncbi:tripartite tricarboxylate transporter substrate binding protein [Microbacterium sp. 18062]|uniref:Bug family tripartite tricarboxylate transporter substrate binding protein n=1 Tax=Microbacterium sp. 18062 TaxID=2681410 RepID=UPI0013584040|nr:tripartite tricarboxylate transporter substrate binding protein [Microbacterium sp. 18062]